MTEDELQKRLEGTLPQHARHGLRVEECQDQDVRLRFSPNGTTGWHMATLLILVDTSLRAAAGVNAEITHLALTRLREIDPGVEVIVLARILRRDRDMVHAEAWLFSHAVVEAALHATATLSVEA